MAGNRDRLAFLVEQEVTSGHSRLNETNLKAIKQICRTSDENVKDAFRLLWQHVDEDHSEVRWSTFLIIRELFERSHCFRELLIGQLNEYMTFVAEIDQRQPLPLPKLAAERLKSASVAAFRSWYEKYGSTYKKLALAYEFLKETKKIDVVGTGVNSSDTLSHDSRDPARRVIDQRKIDTVKQQYEEKQEELNFVLQEFEALLRIVVPDFGEDIPGSVEGSSDLRAHGVVSHAHNLEISVPGSRSLRLTRNSENEALVEKMEENAGLLKEKFLPLLVNWLAIMTRAGASSDDLKICIDRKQTVENILEKVGMLGISFRKGKKREVVEKESDDDEEDEFVDVPEIIPESFTANHDPELTKAICAEPSDEPCCSKSLAPAVEPSSRKDSLLSVAPVRSFGTDLERWGREHETVEVPMQQRFDTDSAYVRPSDNDPERINPEVAASFVTRAFPFAGKFEPVKWFCRARLPNGQLCSRQDRKKCPFHGKVIPRDGTGKPADEKDQKREKRARDKAEAEKTPDWQDPEYLKDLEAATGKSLKVEKRKVKKKKRDSLTNVEKVADTPKNRLAKKIFHPRVARRVLDKVIATQKEDAAAKFAHNWNYIPKL